MISDTLKEAEYIDLVTFRKSGEGVSTPVWAANVNESLYVFSQTDTGKVKRVRNSGKVKIAECTASGKPKGAYCEATASLVTDAAEEKAAYEGLQAKYGWKMSVLNFGSKLSGKAKTRTVIRIDFT